MGRKPLKKHRKKDEKVTEIWLIRILPIFQKEGFKEFTMDEVVKMVGVSKATFYKYYSSKEKLIDAILNWKLAEIGKFQDQLNDTSLSYYDRYFKSIQVTAMATSQISNKFLDDLRNVYPEKWKAVDEFQSYAVNLLEKFYEEGVKDGHLNSINPKLIALTDHLFFSQMSDASFLEKNGLTLHEAFIGYVSLKNEGIIKNPGGIATINQRISEMDTAR